MWPYAVLEWVPDLIMHTPPASGGSTPGFQGLELPTHPREWSWVGPMLSKGNDFVKMLYGNYNIITRTLWDRRVDYDIHNILRWSIFDIPVPCLYIVFGHPNQDSSDEEGASYSSCTTEHHGPNRQQKQSSDYRSRARRARARPDPAPSQHPIRDFRTRPRTQHAKPRLGGSIGRVSLSSNHRAIDSD